MSNWKGVYSIEPVKYVCGHCDEKVAAVEGMHSWDSPPGEEAELVGLLYICPNCDKPTYVPRHGPSIPRPLPEKRVDGLPDEVWEIYEEARKATAAGAYTAAVMACRAILMHVAVDKGAELTRDLTFEKSIDYLEEKEFVTVHSRPWVNQIREMGNAANHRIKVMSEEDAAVAVKFTRNLLRIAYEMQYEYDEIQRQAEERAAEAAKTVAAKAAFEKRRNKDP